ncbi:MAG TPA: dienelactone hydrolase family protein [Polyangiaceae bacterium]|nr:dienelactone hydrolase family protein [Polyangiaceae bacterium]
MSLDRPTSADFHPEVLRLFDQYVHGLLDRRGFLDKAGRFAIAGATAAGLLEALSPNFAQAQQVAPSDARLHGEFLEFDSPRGNGKGRGYLVRPKDAKGKLPVVLVIHENRGLNPHIEDIARRIALENFIAFAPDALFGLGGYPGNEDAARELFQKLDKQKTFEDFVAAAELAQKFPDGNQRLGAVGFCYGGGVAHQLAVRLPTLRAAVPFYGSAPAPEGAAQVKAELLVHLAENDERVNASWPPFEAALQAAHAKFRVATYPGTQHGFHNDTTPRFDAAAAKLAWQGTLELFNRTLRKTH